MDDRRRHQRQLQEATRELRRAETTLVLARERRWGRRDKPAIETASRLVGAAERHVESTRARFDIADHALASARRADKDWTREMNATAPDRCRLDAALEDLNAAMAHTLPDRIRAALTEPTSALWSTLGPPPRTSGGLRAWCGLAEQLEAWNDNAPITNERADRPLCEPRHPMLGHRPGRERCDEWTRLAALLDHWDTIIATAEQLEPHPTTATTGPETWKPALDSATESAVERSAGIVEPTNDIWLGL